MTVVVDADILGAITARLRTFTEVTTLASTRIAGEFNEDWFPGPDAQYAVVLAHSGGPEDPDETMVGIQTSRLDITCYGSSGRAAGLLMRTVKSVLCPDSSQRASFTQAVTVSGNTTQNVHVSSIFPETGMVTRREPDTGYRFAWRPFIVRWMALAS